MNDRGYSYDSFHTFSVSTKSIIHRTVMTDHGFAFYLFTTEIQSLDSDSERAWKTP